MGAVSVTIVGKEFIILVIVFAWVVVAGTRSVILEFVDADIYNF